MRQRIAIGLLAALAACGGGGLEGPVEAAQTPAAAGDACAPVGELQFICDGFRPDNLRMAPDGLVYAAGHTDFRTPSEASNVARIDPGTLEFERIFRQPDLEGFAAATTAVPIAGEIWLGTNRGERIAYFPAP